MNPAPGKKVSGGMGIIIFRLDKTQGFSGHKIRGRIFYERDRAIAMGATDER